MGLCANDSSATQARLRFTQRKLDFILNHLGLQVPADDQGPIRNLVLQGRKIGAVRLYRA